MTMNKFLIVILMLTPTINASGFSEESSSQNDKRFSQLEFLVSKKCHDFVTEKLNTLRDSEGLRYSFTKLFDQDESFNNVEGLITLYADAKYKYIDLLKIKTKSTFDCEPNRTVSFTKDKKGWAYFIETVEELEREGKFIHSIQLDDKYIKILTNTN